MKRIIFALLVVAGLGGRVWATHLLSLNADNISAGTLAPERVSPSSFTLQGNSVKFLNGGVVFGDGSVQTTAQGPGAQQTFSSATVGPNRLEIIGSTDTNILFKSSGAFISGPLNDGRNAPTLTSNTGFGTISWAGTEGNARTQDGIAANMALSNGTSSYWLVASSFAFNIPGNATITSIKLYAMAKGSSGSSINWVSARVMKNGSISSTTDDGQGTFSATYSTLTVSGGGLWGLTWTPQDINSPGFGAAFSFRATAVGQTLSVDWVGIEVTYIVQDWALGTSRENGTFQISNSSSALMLPKVVLQDNYISLSTYTQIGSSQPFPVANTLLKVGPDLTVSKDSYIGFKRSTPVAAVDLNGQAGTNSPLFLVSTGTSKIMEVSGGSIVVSAPLYTSNPLEHHEVWYSTSNGFGSTNTKIKFFSSANLIISSGSAITCTGNSVAGTSCTINANGYYSITYSDQHDGAVYLGVSVNSNELTTDINTINRGHRRLITGTAGANNIGSVSGVLFLRSGDVVRAHGAGTAQGTSTLGESFRIIKLPFIPGVTP